MRLHQANIYDADLIVHSTSSARYISMNRKLESSETYISFFLEKLVQLIHILNLLASVCRLVHTSIVFRSINHATL